MQEIHATLESIGAAVARIDERTVHMLNHQVVTNGRVGKHDDRIDGHDVELAKVNGRVSGLRSNLKLYIALGALGVGGAAGHEQIGSIFAALMK